MGQFLTAHVVVEGFRPLLWHKFGPDAIPNGSGGRKVKTGSAGNDPEEWRKTVLMTEARQLYVEPQYVFGCLRDGAKYTPLKRGTLQSALASSLQVLDEIILIDRFVPEEPLPTDKNEPVYLYVTGVKNPQTRARNVRYRVAASPGWHCEFNVLWDQTILNKEQMGTILKDAGNLCGLGDGRSIGNGRFTVQTYEVKDA